MCSARPMAVSRGAPAVREQDGCVEVLVNMNATAEFARKYWKGILGPQRKANLQSLRMTWLLVDAVGPLFSSANAVEPCIKSSTSVLPPALA